MWYTARQVLLQSNFASPARALLLIALAMRSLRVVGLALNHPIVCSDWWAKIADAELRRLGLPYHKWDDALIAEYAKDANVIRERDV